jgi:hypothetical protein
MVTYVKDEVRGRTLHLVMMDKSAKMYVDATRRIKEAERVDRDRGYKNGGPNMAQEIEKAREYAKYVETYATPETLYHYHTRDYGVFEETRLAR